MEKNKGESKELTDDDIVKLNLVTKRFRDALLDFFSDHIKDIGELISNPEGDVEKDLILQLLFNRAKKDKDLSSCLQKTRVVCDTILKGAGID